MHIASRYKERELCALLISYGFDPNLYIVQIREEECLLDYRIFGLLFDHISNKIFDDYNWPIKKMPLRQAINIYYECLQKFINSKHVNDLLLKTKAQYE